MVVTANEELAAEVARSAEWRRKTQTAIDCQRKQVALLVPGCAAHRAGTSVLLLMQDTMHVLDEAHRMLRAADAALADSKRI